MATLKAIRKRISSIRNTQQITKAMKMVSAAKLRRAQAVVESARPYATDLAAVLANLAEASLGRLPRTKTTPRHVVLNAEAQGILARALEKEATRRFASTRDRAAPLTAAASTSAANR